MVWHEAVRKNCHVLSSGGAQKLVEHEMDDSGVREERPSVGRAGRQEITVKSDVGESLQASRPSLVHAADTAKDLPPRPEGLGHTLKVPRPEGLGHTLEGTQA